MGQVISDIFSMSFDIVIPLSSCIAAVLLAGVLFAIRYMSYRKNKRKYETGTASQDIAPAVRREETQAAEIPVDT